MSYSRKNKNKETTTYRSFLLKRLNINNIDKVLYRCTYELCCNGGKNIIAKTWKPHNDYTPQKLENLAPRQE